MRKYKYVIIVAIVTIIIIGLTTIVLFNIKKADTEKGSQIIANTTSNEEKTWSGGSEENTVIITSNQEEEKVSPNAIIIFNKYYKKCDHTITTRENVTNEMVNLNKEQFAQLYSDWKIKSFDNNQIVLYKEFNEECGEHYVVKAESGSIVVYKITTGGELQLIKDTEISTQYLPQIDLDSLDQGVTLVGKEELNAYIENFE